MRKGFLDGKLSIKQVIQDADSIFHNARWISGVVYCPYCGEVHKVYTCKEGYKCGKCGRRFTDRTKTLLHGSKLSTQVWMQGIYEVFTNNFIASTQLAIKLHINQKSAWLMLSKIRMGLLQNDYMLQGVIAQDEMYLGGSLSNMHYGRKLELIKKYGLNYNYKPTDNPKLEKQRRLRAIYQLNDKLKQPVFAMNNGSQIVMYATPNPIKQKHVMAVIDKHVMGKDNLFVCDESGLYNRIPNKEVNNHRNNQYMTADGLTSNPIENTFSWYKRGFDTLTHCQYYQLYLNEFVFRFNTRALSHSDRFTEALKHTIGKVVTYNDIKAYKELSFKKVLKRK